MEIKLIAKRFEEMCEFWGKMLEVSRVDLGNPLLVS